MNNNKKIKRIALVNPFQATTDGYDLDSVRNKGQLAEIPLGLAYISAMLKQHGYEVKIFDAHIMAVKGLARGDYADLSEIREKLVSDILDFSPDVIGISCLFHYIYRGVHDLIETIKKARSEIVSVIGGAYATVSTEVAMRDENIDFAILGEGEKPFLNLLEAINGKFDFKNLKSIAYRDDCGKVIIVRECDTIESLDEIPLPDRSDFILEDYYKYGRHFIQKFEEYYGRELKIATLTATRGCVFDCSFCIGKRIWGGGLRTRSPQNILDEIEFLNKKHGINYFAFNDDNLLINKRFSHEFLRGIIGRKLKIGWTTAGMNVRGLDEEMVELMIDSGCLIFNIAIESANNVILKKIRKPLHIDEVYGAVEIIRKYDNAYLMGLFMLGFPEETEQQFRETISLGKSLKSDWTLYSCLTPFPGSEVYEEAKSKGMLPENIEDDYEKLSFRNYILKPKYLTNEFVSRESYFANLDQNFFENPNLYNGKSDIALSDFKNVVKLSKSHASAYYCIGRIYEEKGQQELAQDYYKLAKNNLSGLHKKYFERMNITIP